VNQALAAALIATVASGALTGAGQTPTAGIAIEGRVVDALTRQPVRGAIVTANLSRAAILPEPAEAVFLTGHDGRFVVRALPAGTIGLHVTKTGYVDSVGDQLTRAQGARKMDIEIGLTPEALISGRVLDQSGDPVEQVTVRAVRKGNETQFDRGESATTDDLGAYLIGKLEAGEYVVGIVAERTATRAHEAVFFTTASRPEDATVVKVSTGAERTGVDFVLHVTASPWLVRAKELPVDDATGGTIAGRVRDADGRGLPRASVVLIRAEGESPAAGTHSDENGRFEFLKIPPGQFRVLASRAGYSTVGGDTADVPPRDAGSVVHLRAAQHVTTVTLTLSKDAAISGTLTDQFGDPLAGGVGLLPADGAPSERYSARANPRGQFRIGGVRPGDYLVIAHQDPHRWPMHMRDESGQERRVALLATYHPGVAERSLAVPITITPNRDLSGMAMVIRPVPVTTIDVTVAVTLPLALGARLEGRVAFEGSSPHPQSVHVSLAPMPPTVGDFARLSADVSVDRGMLEFAIPDIMPGRYFLQGRDRSNPESWVLKSATINGREALDDPVDFASSADLGNVVLTFSDRVTELSGTVTDAAGRPAIRIGVIAFSADARHWRSDSPRVKFASVDRGRYLIRGLPPGDYRLALATPAGTNYAPMLKKLLPNSVPISLTEGERKIQDLRR